MNLANGTPGALALVGSGEYLDVMNETDLFLLNTLGGPDQARVVVIPTASGLEPGMPRRWSEMGVAHFERLGAKVEPAMLVTREDTADPDILAVLRQANFFYFSGGNPNHLVETLRDTPAWELISQAHRQGAVLAGCSAGAMAFGGYTISIRSVMQGQAPQWVPALGVVPQLATLPHFDRMATYVGAEMFKTIFARTPSPSLVLLGVDEDTALVRLPLTGPEQGWQVMGRQKVSVFDADKQGLPAVYPSGAVISLPAD